MEKKFIHFNTGNMYTPEGQRIVAMSCGGCIHFIDIDRGVNGYYHTMDGKMSETRIMESYDRGGYQQERDPQELLDYLTELGWKSFFYQGGW
jgi:hypothetical protein